jgi:hypothetical protein
MSAKRSLVHVAIALGAAVATLGGLAQLGFAKTSGPFTVLAGTWSGSGQARLDGGRSETLKCKASYTDRNDGAGLGIALRCAGSAAGSIDLRASLASNGGRVSGNWEERQYNASGSVSGQVSGNRISVSINGGGLNGTMNVTTNGSSQSVQISTDGGTFKGMSIGLSRN